MKFISFLLGTKRVAWPPPNESGPDSPYVEQNAVAAQVSGRNFFGTHPPDPVGTVACYDIFGTDLRNRAISLVL